MSMLLSRHMGLNRFMTGYHKTRKDEAVEVDRQTGEPFGESTKASRPDETMDLPYPAVGRVEMSQA